MKYYKLILPILTTFLCGCSVAQKPILITDSKNDIITDVANLSYTTKIEVNSEEDISEKNNDIYEEISLVYAGDNLIHKTIIKYGLNNSFNMYDNVKDYINKFDIRGINQETVLIDDDKQYSGYPTFGSPISLGQAVVDSGFNLVTQATNHAYDKKEQGILDSINFWKEKNIPILGIHDNPNDNVFIWETQTMKIAMVNYTYGLNGFVLPKGKEYLVDDLYSDKVISDLQYAEENADITIAFPHWGTEYTHTEISEQIRIAQMLVDNGADIIIGCHPHVVEPLKKIVSSSGKEVPCFYSVGNFISAQNEIPRMLGALAEVVIENNNGIVSVKSAKMTPIVTHIQKGYSSFETYLLDDYTEELANIHQLRKHGLTVDKLNDLWNTIIENNTWEN